MHRIKNYVHGRRGLNFIVCVGIGSTLLQVILSSTLFYEKRIHDYI
jgi:hypothetical protein